MKNNTSALVESVTVARASRATNLRSQRSEEAHARRLTLSWVEGEDPRVKQKARNFFSGARARCRKYSRQEDLLLARAAISEAAREMGEDRFFASLEEADKYHDFLMELALS